MLQEPALGGVTLRRPNRYTPGTAPVQESVQLAGGGLRRYVRGVRGTHSLEWRNLPEAHATVIVDACRARGPILFRDPHGVSSWVFVESYPDPVPVPGTDPPRYDVTVELVGRDIR